MLKLFLFFIIFIQFSINITHAQVLSNSNLGYSSSLLGLDAGINSSGKLTFEGGEKKNIGLAIIYSLLLPGMGELYAGNYSSGKYFTIAEASLWGVFAGVKYYADVQEKNYKDFAKTSGGVDLTGKDKDYFANIANYTNISEYNNDKASQRRFSEMYDPNSFNWKWQTQQDRKDYRGLWVSSESASNNLRFVVGAMLLNRLVSAVNAVRLVASHNKNITTSWDIYLNYGSTNNSLNMVTFNFVKEF